MTSLLQQAILARRRDSSNSNLDLVSVGVVGLGVLFFITAGLKTISTVNRIPSSQSHGNQSSQDANQRRGKTTDQSTVQVTYTTTLDMCDTGGHTLRPRHKIRAGALFKLIDIVAGVTARKHAEMSCVTISVDSVLLLKPIYLDDLVHLSASVNRAWGSSLEVGVRVVKEDPSTGEREYVSHSYLTFVAVSSAGSTSSGLQPPPRVRLASRAATVPNIVGENLPPSMLGWFHQWLSSSNRASQKTITVDKPQLQPLIPTTPLEVRRHILAGRRREKRIDNAKRGEARDGVSTEVKKRVKEQVLEISQRVGRAKSVGIGLGIDGQDASVSQFKLDDQDYKAIGHDLSGQQGAKTTQDLEMETIELQFVVRAYVEKDPAVSVKEDQNLVEINLAGDVPLRQSLKLVRKLAQQLPNSDPPETEIQPLVPLVTSRDVDGAAISPTAEGVSQTAFDTAKNATPHARRFSKPSSYSAFSPLKAGHEEEEEEDTASIQVENPIPKPIKVANTMAKTLHIVFPEHTNSVSVLFGGQLMDWMEEAALLTVRHIGRGKRWGTVSLDGLEFEQAVAIGEVMTFTAIVVQSFVQSCEVYVVAEAEAPNGTRRITNDALFTLAFSLEENDAARSTKSLNAPQLYLGQVEMPAGSALETFANVAPQRRKTRLEMKDMLNRIYSDPR